MSEQWKQYRTKDYVEPKASLSDEELAQIAQKPALPLPPFDADVNVENIQQAWDEVSRLWPEAASKIDKIENISKNRQKQSGHAAAIEVDRRGKILHVASHNKLDADILWHELVHVEQIEEGRVHPNDPFQTESEYLASADEQEAFQREEQAKNTLERFRKIQQAEIGKAREQAAATQPLMEGPADETILPPQPDGTELPSDQSSILGDVQVSEGEQSTAQTAADTHRAVDGESPDIGVPKSPVVEEPSQRWSDIIPRETQEEANEPQAGVPPSVKDSDESLREELWRQEMEESNDIGGLEGPLASAGDVSAAAHPSPEATKESSPVVVENANAIKPVAATAPTEESAQESGGLEGPLANAGEPQAAESPAPVQSTQPNAAESPQARELNPKLAMWVDEFSAGLAEGIKRELGDVMGGEPQADSANIDAAAMPAAGEADSVIPEGIPIAAGAVDAIPEGIPIAQHAGDVLGETGAEEVYDPVEQVKPSKKKRPKRKESDWAGFLGGMGKGIGSIGAGMKSKDPFSMLAGGLRGASQIMGAWDAFGDSGGDEAESLLGGDAEGGGGGLAGAVTNVLGGDAKDTAATASVDGDGSGDDLVKVMQKLTEAIEKLIEKMGNTAQPEGGVGGTNMPTGGSLGGAGGSMEGSGDMKQLMQLIEFLATLMRMLAMAA